MELMEKKIANEVLVKFDQNDINVIKTLVCFDVSVPELFGHRGDPQRVACEKFLDRLTKIVKGL